MPFTDADAQGCRGDFPALARTLNGQEIAYLDGPGGTQVPNLVLDATRSAYIDHNANFDGRFTTSVDAGSAVAEARTAVADFLGASGSSQISFGANMTTLNFSLSHGLARSMKRGDGIVITQLDHEANRGPWLKLRDQGIVVREAKLNIDGTLDAEDFSQQINERTRIVAIGMASNALGTVTDLRQARELCDKFGAYLVVDAVHFAAHFPLDVTTLGVDFLFCSAYKFYGPHIGILYSRSGLLDRIDTDHLSTAKGLAPHRIETGTLNHAAIAGVKACIDYIAQWGHGNTRRVQIVSAMDALHHYEIDLAKYYYERVNGLPRARVWGPRFDARARAPTVSISLDNQTPEHIATALGQEGLQVWHGHFYARKVLEVLGLVESGGLLRVGISMYNTRAEIDRLLNALERLTE